MQQVEIDGTSVRVSRLAFGTASLHHLFRQSQRQQLLEAALAAGITHFDTAPYYGYGLAESELGAFLRRHRGSVTVATKVGLHARGGEARGIWQVWARKAAGKVLGRFSFPRFDWCIAALERSLNDSLRRLRTDHVEFLFLHEPNPGELRSEEVLAWLQSARAEGKLSYWGVAGDPRPIKGWLREGHPLAAVVQAKDSLSKQEANVLLQFGRHLQFTYGYLASMRAANGRPSVASVLREALIRNDRGTVVFSTRRSERIAELAKIVP